VSRSTTPTGYAGWHRTAPQVRSRVVRAACAAAALLAAVGLGACGQPTRADTGIAPTVSVAVQPTIVPVTPTLDPPDTTAPVQGGLFDAGSSLVDETCAAVGDVWSFSGTVENADSAPHTFTVGVFIVRRSDSSTVATKEIDVTVAAGERAPVAAKAFYRGPAAGVECLTGVTVKDQ
jgi:hypothetical protein